MCTQTQLTHTYHVDDVCEQDGDSNDGGHIHTQAHIDDRHIIKPDILS
jgi:hypothetical protein